MKIGRVERSIAESDYKNPRTRRFMTFELDNSGKLFLQTEIPVKMEQKPDLGVQKSTNSARVMMQSRSE